MLTPQKDIRDLKLSTTVVQMKKTNDLASLLASPNMIRPKSEVSNSQGTTNNSGYRAKKPPLKIAAKMANLIKSAAASTSLSTQMKNAPI